MIFVIEVEDDSISVSFPRGLYHSDMETVNQISLAGALNRMAEISEGEADRDKDLNFYQSLATSGIAGQLALKIMASMFITLSDVRDPARYLGDEIEPWNLELYGKAAFSAASYGRLMSQLKIVGDSDAEA